MSNKYNLQIYLAPTIYVDTDYFVYEETLFLLVYIKIILISNGPQSGTKKQKY